MIQERVDELREWLVGRYQAKAQRNVRLRDHFRWQINRHWSEIIPAWMPWVAMIVFWLLLGWAVWAVWP